MAQEGTRQKLNVDPLHDVKEEIEHHSPVLKHVELPDEAPEAVQSEGIVKGKVPEAFLDELKEGVSTPDSTVYNIGGSEKQFEEADPLHAVKQEIESGSVPLKHVESPDASVEAPPGGNIVKSVVPAAFEEELKSDHDIVGGTPRGDVSKENAFEGDGIGPETKAFNTGGSVAGRGTPVYRVSAHHGMRPGGPLSRDLKSEASEVELTADAGVTSEQAKPEESSSSSLQEDSGGVKTTTLKNLSGRGIPHFRISAHHGMRPGGPLSRDVKAESNAPTETGDFAGDKKGAAGPGLPGAASRGGLSSSAARRGGLARQGSGVPGDQKGGGGGTLGRTGSGVPGNGLARQNSGVPGFKGGNPLKDFDLSDFKAEN